MRAFNMNAKAKYAILFVVLLLCFVAWRVFISALERTSAPQPSENTLYLNESAPSEMRIDDLLSSMTLEEKVGQMALVEKNSVRRMSDIPAYGLGALLSGAGAKPEDNTIAGWDTMVSDFISASRESRLGIPILYGVDAVHGHGNVPGATIFPHFIGLGATRNPVLVEKVARATAQEVAATGIRWSFSPTLDLPRDIRWGRVYEAFSDDPALTALLGRAYISGLQNNTDPLSFGTSNIFVLGTAKHFIGVGTMTWGSAVNKEYKIDQGYTPPDEQALRLEYLPPFKAAVDAGVQSIMIGLNRWGTLKLSESRYLLTTVLKEELGFDGFAVSDWYGVYEVPGNDYRSAVTAINAGIDMVMLPFDYKPFIKNVLYAVRTGEISEERIDDAVRRILRAKFALGLFDADEPLVPHGVIGSPAHRALAREAVAQSLVLLKNDEDILPISADTKHIRIAGSAADNLGMQMGAWTVEWQGVDGNWLSGGTSILEGIGARAGARVTVEYDRAGDFPARGEIAELGIAIVGEKPYAEGVGDREYPVLPPEDLDAIKKLQKTCKKVTVVIVSGRPLFVANEIGSWDAVVAAWLPGSEGSGVADVLFGDVPFTGTLSLPWPHHSAQLPITSDGTTADRTPPLFPRSFGLHY